MVNVSVNDVVNVHASCLSLSMSLFSHTCSLCCCSSVSAKVSVPYRHAGVTHVLVTLPFSLLETQLYK